jgi:hypothetical protein
MASALKYANNDGNAKIVHMKKRGYIEIFSENLPKNLRSLTIKVAEVFEGGHVECYYAKLRVIVVAKDNKSIITVFPQVNKI